MDRIRLTWVDPVEPDCGEAVLMTRVTLLRDALEPNEATYRAVGGKIQTPGRTAGEALDALVARLPEEIDGTMIIVRDLRPDRFFSAEQRARLQELMERNDSDEDLPSEQQAELESLVEAEIETTVLRAEEAWHESHR